MPVNYKEYPENWKEISKFIRFERAKNCCEKCGAENYKPHPHTKKGAKVVLSVAHLDQNISNNDYKNLKALCQKCHLNHDRGDNNFRKRYGKKLHLIQLRLFI